ncbi:MAG: lytic transglycosylase domain-containing protein [Clostridia bacterium]|nr:lytic transglycosylase domain-containing protein [Clostridia bacterium]
MKNKIKYSKTISFIIYTILLILTILLAIYIYIIVNKRLIYPIKYNDYVQEAASINKVDPNLIYAIIKQESKFDPKVISNKDAKGLMQVMESTAKEVAADIDYIDEDNLDLFNPEINIAIGSKYYRWLLDRYDGNMRLALCAYNAGPGNVDKWIQVEEIYNNGNLVISAIPFEETKNYVISVINNYNKYVKLYK